MPTLVQQGFYDGVPVQGVEVLLLLAQVPQVLHRVRLAHAADCPFTGRCHSVTPSPEGNDASHDNDNDNDNDNDSDAVLTPESGQQPSLHQSGSITG